MRRLLQNKNLMVSVNSREGKYISVLDIIQGLVDPMEVHKSLQRLRELNNQSFIPWGPSSIQVALARPSPYIASAYKVTGLMMANHTCMGNVRDGDDDDEQLFAKLAKQFDKSYKRRAYLHNYTELDIFKDLTEFDESREVVSETIDEYKRAESSDYISVQYLLFVITKHDM